MSKKLAAAYSAATGKITAAKARLKRVETEKNFCFKKAILASTLCLALSATAAFGLDQNIIHETIPFQKNYLGIEIARNAPTDQSDAHFTGGHPGLMLSYYHLVDANWMMTIGGNFKRLNRRDINRELSLLTLSHASNYIVRLYHPYYLLVGAKLLYMLPSRRNTIPATKESDFVTEIGVGLTATLAAHLSENSFTFMRFDRWRGTKTSRLHGFEVSAGFSYSFW